MELFAKDYQEERVAANDENSEEGRGNKNRSHFAEELVSFDGDQSRYGQKGHVSEEESYLARLVQLQKVDVRRTEVDTRLGMRIDVGNGTHRQTGKDGLGLLDALSSHPDVVCITDVGKTRRARVGVAVEPFAVSSEGHEHEVVEKDEVARLKIEEETGQQTDQQQQIADTGSDGSDSAKDDADRKRGVLPESQFQGGKGDSDDGQLNKVDEQKGC